MRSIWNEKIAEKSSLIFFFFFGKAEHTKPKSSEKCLTVTEGDQSKYPKAKVLTVALETEP